ncbi:MAG: inositol monophosphatase [Acidobacteria bacterium]|nr:inositol monophosphatase [Acidobacteriota bacterium]
MRPVPDVVGAVAALLAEAAETAVMPVYGQLAADPQEKSPGEWVTVADRSAEARLSPRLAALLPGSVVVGEEAASADPRITRHLATTRDVWLLDPLDGTVNFAAGRPPFSMMVAQLRDGEAVRAWLLDPLTGSLAVAERGAGATVDGDPVQIGSRGGSEIVRGAVLRRFLPPPMIARVEQVEREDPRVELGGGSGCAGSDYLDLVRGELDFVLFWRTLPWDHVPGVLFLTEAGGIAGRLDGQPFRAADSHRPGLLVAGDEHLWHACARTFDRERA